MSNSFWSQGARYAVVGSIVYAVDLGTFWTLISFVPPENYLLANIASKIVGASLGFALHKMVTFRWRQRNSTSVQTLGYSALIEIGRAHV